MSTMSGAVQSHLTSALNSMNLVTATGQPTPTLDKLVHSDGKEQQQLILELLKQSFPFLFQDGFKLATDTAKHFDEQFDKAGLASETGRKCKAFFLAAAKDAGIELSTYILKGSRGQKVSRKIKSAMMINGKPLLASAPKADPPPPSDRTPIPAESSMLIMGLFQRLPKPGTPWAKADRDRWRQTFDQVLGMEYPEA